MLLPCLSGGSLLIFQSYHLLSGKPNHVSRSFDPYTAKPFLHGIPGSSRFKPPALFPLHCVRAEFMKVGCTGANPAAMRGTERNDCLSGKIIVLQKYFGLLVGQMDIGKYDYIRLPMKDIWGVLMRKDSPLAAKEAVSAEDLWDKPLIISHQTSINSEMFSWLKADISRLNIVATYDLVYNAAQFVKKGFGYVIALDRLINTTGDSNLCFRPLFPALEAELCIIWKKYQVLSRASDIFLKQLREELNALK